MAGGFIGYNRNKKSLALNLRAEAGREVYRRLAQVSDAVVENLRPGAMEKMGLGYEDLDDHDELRQDIGLRVAVGTR